MTTLPGASEAVLIGNDIVDLAEGDGTARSWFDRFCQRVCTAGERQAIDASSNARVTLWSIWAAKEAAFKALRRARPDFEFEYKELIVSSSFTRVFARGCSFHLELTTTSDYVHALCKNSAALSRRTFRWIDQIAAGPGGRVEESERESRLARMQLRLNLAAEFGLSPESVSVIARGSAPIVTLGLPLKAHSASLSHHGRFIASAAAI